MNRKWGTIAGALLISAGLLAGGAVAQAAEKLDRPDVKEKLQEKVREGKLTPGEAEVMQKLHDLRRSYHDKFRTDARALIDQAVKEGKITQEQADKFRAPRKHRHEGGPVMKQKDRDGDQKK